MGRLGARLADLLRKQLCGIGAALFVVALVLVGPLERWEYLWFDQLFELRGARPPTAPIVIVTIDESSFQELSLQWPFPRALHGQLIDRIRADRPLVIGLDIIFDSDSMFGPKDDEALGAAVARAGNVVLGLAGAQDDQPLISVSGKVLGAKREVSNMPLPVIRKGAGAVAPLTVVPDPDSHVRRIPVRVPVPDPVKGYEWWLAFDAQLHRQVSAAGLATRPLPDAEEILVNFRGGPRTFQRVPYYRVVRGEIPAGLFRAKIVLIGSTSEVQHDVFATAFARGGDMPGVEIHANALETLIRGDPIREVPKPLSTVLAVVAALVGSALVVRLHALRALVVTVVLFVVGFLLAYAGFLLADVWMRGVACTFALVLGYGATVVENFVHAQLYKRRLSPFFSPDVLRALVRARDEQSLGPRRRVATVLFSDIRGFTSISERLQPEQVEEMLGEYLTEMTQIVFKHRGSVDKYMGDGIMALYNAPFEDPEHALNAIRTGLEFQERALAVSARWQEKLGVSIRIGVGINTGEMLVGTLGSRQRFEYTALGDNVNLASRLESVTKDHGASIIISEYTYEHVKGRFPTRELGDVTVKGKSRPVKIYGVVPAGARKHPRAALRAVATLTARGEGRVCRVRTVDIGEGGLALAGVPPEWEVGCKIQIRLEGGDLPRRIVAEGTIVSRRGEAAGVQFTSLDEDAAPVVADYVARGREATSEDQH
jgi:adenylate cyclase